MRWYVWLMPLLGVIILIIGNVVNIRNRFQGSTGWIGFFVFMAAFFVLLGVEQMIRDAR